MVLSPNTSWMGPRPLLPPIDLAKILDKAVLTDKIKYCPNKGVSDPIQLSDEGVRNFHWKKDAFFLPGAYGKGPIRGVYGR